MRALLLGVILSAIALPCVAKTILKLEPLVLAPYEVAFVQDASCPAGKVLKVTGAIRGLHRKKACVTLAAEQASLAVAMATPWVPQRMEVAVGSSASSVTSTTL